MNIAQNLKMIDANILQIENMSISIWVDEVESPFAYSFSDGSAIVNVSGKGLLACSEKALKRWCSNSRIDKLLTIQY